MSQKGTIMNIFKSILTISALFLFAGTGFAGEKIFKCTVEYKNPAAKEKEKINCSIPISEEGKDAYNVGWDDYLLFVNIEHFRLESIKLIEDETRLSLLNLESVYIENGVFTVKTLDNVEILIRFSFVEK